MKKVRNNTESDIAVQIKGTQYIVQSNNYLVVPDDVAEYWQKNLHNFLVIEEHGDVAVKDESKDIVATDTEETTEELGDGDMPENVKKEDEEDGEEVILEGLGRKDLDEIAEGLGLDSSEYRNKPTLIEAIEAAKLE